MRILNWLLKAAGATDVEKKTEAQLITEQRKFVRNPIVNWMFGTLANHATVREESIAGDGNALSVRIYERKNSKTLNRPAVLYMHGGGWVSGDAGMTDWWCSNVAANVDAVILSLNYRLSPTNRYPAALSDCLRTLTWLQEHATALQVDPGLISVGGDSAGANLAASLCLKVREAAGPAISSQILIYPSLDLTLCSPSVAEIPEGVLLTKKAATAYVRHYLGAANTTDPFVSPLLADEFTGLPPALIQVAEHDPLRDDGWRYAKRLESGGVSVKVTEYAGASHGFVSFPGLTPIAKRALAEASSFLESGARQFRAE